MTQGSNTKILIIGINYYPEDSAIGIYTTQKAEYLAEKGFDVTVITGFPYYPQWEIHSDYKGKSYLLKKSINGVDVFRSKQYVPRNPTFFKRIIHLISFTIGNFINLFRIPKPDVVIAIIPFTTSAFLGWLLKLRYRSKLWIHIQDFEFDAALDSGLLKGRFKTTLNALLWMEKKVLNRADAVSTISLGMMNKLSQKTKAKTFYLANWIDISLFKTKEKCEHPYFSSEKFSILYSGNIGAKQDWNFFFEFIKDLETINIIEVVVVGEGAEKEKVIKEIDKYKFVKHYNLVPFEELPLLLSGADLHILFQKKDVIDTVMPSKLLGMMASSKPSIVTGNLKSEIATIFTQSNAGYFFDGNSTREIIDCLVGLKNDKSLSQKIGENAKKYVAENFSKEKILKTFSNQLEQL